MLCPDFDLEKRDESALQWESNHAIAKDIILRSVCGTTERNLLEIESAHDMWEAIKKQFVDQPGSSCTMALAGLRTLAQNDGEDLESFIRRFKDLKQRLSDLKIVIQDVALAYLLIMGASAEHQVTKEYLINLGDTLST